MKYKLLIPFVLLVALFVRAADPILYVPELKPITFMWDHNRLFGSPDTFYRFYAGTNLVQTVTTNNFTILGVTNGVSTIQASIVFPHSLVGPTATNQLSVTAIDPNFDPAKESAHTSNVLTGQVLGEPLPPSGTRKP